MEVCGGEDICTGGGRSGGHYKEMLEITIPLPLVCLLPHHEPSSSITVSITN